MPVLDLAGWDNALKQGGAASAYFFYSTDEYLLESAVGKLMQQLVADGEEPTVLPGPQPDIGQVVAAAGAISLFGTKRIVYLRRIEPTTMKADDVKLLCELVEELENAVLIITMLVKEPQYRTRGKEALPLPAVAKKLQQVVLKAGLVAALAKPTEADTARFAVQKAKELGATLEPAAAKELVARCGIDLYLITNEVEKLSAAAGYAAISPALVRTLSPRNIEVDVFDMVRALMTGKSREAFAKLAELLYLQNEPVAIAAAMNSSFTDMIRVKAAAQQGISYTDAFRRMGGSGSDYRYKKSLETAKSFSMRQLETFLEIVDRLDRRLKGSAVDKNTLLQAAMGEILLAGRGNRTSAHS